MVCNDRGRMGLVGREVGGREWRAVMEEREWGGEQGMVGSGGGEGVNAYYGIKDDDDDNVVVVVPRPSASVGATSPNATRSRSPVASFVALGTWCACRLRLWALVVV